MGLKSGSLLGEGRYRIVRELGQGGFGITYLAIQKGLDREVAIKEFFMKELCERDVTTSQVSIGTEGGRETVERFREKFLKEARNIGKLNHPNIVRIMDIFEENGTAYYVMEYAANGSMADKVKKEGYLPEVVATRYITQVAEALDYIHQHKMNHLDVKPANIILSEKDMPILIDFGLSKQYDNVTGGQTSTTPVGISEGYAPMEQYMQGGVGVFSPETDIYSLGATFYKLLTGNTPPNASIVTNEGLPLDDLKAKGISDKAIAVIQKAMEGRKKDRMKSAKEFIDGLIDMASSPVTMEKEKEVGATTIPEKDKADDLASEDTRLIDKDTESTKIIVNEQKPQQSTSKAETLKEPNPSSNVKVSVVSNDSEKPKDSKNIVSFIFGGILLIMAIIGIIVLRNIANSPMINGQKYRGDNFILREFSSSRTEETFNLSNTDLTKLKYTTPPEWCHIDFSEDGSQFTITCDKNAGEKRSTAIILWTTNPRYAQMYIVQEGGNVSEIAKSTPEKNEVQTTRQTSVSTSDSKQSSTATQQDKAKSSSAPSNSQNSASSVSSSGSKPSSVTQQDRATLSSTASSGADMALSNAELALSEGETFTLRAYNYGSSLRWESQNTGIATVDDSGKVTAVSPGKTIIWAHGGVSLKKCSVIVSPKTERGSNRTGNTVRTVYSKTITMGVGESIRAELYDGKITRWEIPSQYQKYCSCSGDIIIGKQAGSFTLWGYIRDTPKLFEVTIRNN